MTLLLTATLVDLGLLALVSVVAALTVIAGRLAARDRYAMDAACFAMLQQRSLLRAY